LLPTERNKTLTALANTEPLVGAQRKEAQGLQNGSSPSRAGMLRPSTSAGSSFCSKIPGRPPTRRAPWGHRRDRRPQGRQEDRSCGGRQYLSSIGKIDNGVVSVGSLWADERTYTTRWRSSPTPPLVGSRAARPIRAFAPKASDSPRTSRGGTRARGIPFRAVVADILYGEHRKLKEGLERRGIPYVMAIKPS
jgi:hypothetical protein